MNEMIEKLAKGHAFARRSRHDQARDAEHYWEHLGRETQAAELDAARAAIEAIEKMGFVIVPREPTEAMIDAHEALCVFPSERERVDYRDSLREAWATMIAALAKD